MNKQMSKKDDAVSPVIGVMLMIVVTIIIAAVVALFASGVINTTSAAPSATFDVKVTNTSLKMELVSTSDKIPSKDLKIAITSNGSTVIIEPQNKVNKDNDNRTPFGFHIVETTNANGFLDSSNKTYSNSEDTFKGTSKQAVYKDNYNQWFGNYTLQAGSVMSASGDAFKDMIPQNARGFENKNEWDTLKDFLNRSISSDTMWFSVFQGVPIKAESDGSNKPTGNHVLELEMDKNNDYMKKIMNFYTPALENGKKYYFVAGDYNAWDFSKAKTDLTGKVTYKPNQNADVNGEKDYLKAGEVVTITITHTPSNKVLYSDNVIVERD